MCFLKILPSKYEAFSTPKCLPCAKDAVDTEASDQCKQAAFSRTIIAFLKSHKNIFHLKFHQVNLKISMMQSSKTET